MTDQIKAKTGSLRTPIQWLLWALIFALSILPLISTMNELLAKLAIATKSNLVIENLIVPTMAKVIGSILRFVFGVKTTVVGDSIFLITQGLPYQLYLSWNCIGWQSIVFLLFSLVTLLQDRYSMKSKLKCALLGLEMFIVLNLLRIVTTAILLLKFGYGLMFIFHDQVSIIITFVSLALFWYISSSFILEQTGERKSLLRALKCSVKDLKLSRLIPDFIFGRRTMGLVMMTLILLTTALSGVALLSGKVSGDTDMTQLSFEYVDPAVIVNTATINRILTLPPSDLGTTPHTDSHTTSGDKYELAWSFYLYGPLNEDYEMKGDLTFVVYMFASEECEVKIKFKICAVDEEGVAHQKFSEYFKTELGTSSPSEPYEFEEDTSKEKFKEGEALLVEIWLESVDDEVITYYFQYDSTNKHSYIDLPGVVVSEELTPYIYPMFISNVFILLLRKRKFLY